MTELCWFQARPLCELMDNRGHPVERGSKTDPVIWLDRLAAIFRHTNIQIDNPNEPHPCQSVITEVSNAMSADRCERFSGFIIDVVYCLQMWPVLSNICNVYQEDPRLMERCCRCIRFAVRCIGKHSMNILEPLVKQVRDSTTLSMDRVRRFTFLML